MVYEICYSGVWDLLFWCMRFVIVASEFCYSGV